MLFYVISLQKQGVFRTSHLILIGWIIKLNPFLKTGLPVISLSFKSSDLVFQGIGGGGVWGQAAPYFVVGCTCCRHGGKWTVTPTHLVQIKI